jgi:hypothetical protein
MVNMDRLCTIERDWFGASLPGPLRWALAIDNGILALRGAVASPPICVAHDRECDFAEGLWEADVAELFLVNSRTGFYMEFNLAPRGAWWCCTFDSPRARSADGAKPIEGVQIRAACTEKGWDSALSVPLKSLPNKLAFDIGATLGNITFCLGKPQQFVTLADLGGGEPDFHRPDKWVPLGKILAMR